MTDLEFLRWYREQLEDMVMPIGSDTSADLDADVIRAIQRTDTEIEELEASTA